MKKFFMLFCILFATNAFTAEICNDSNFPTGTCHATGYVCGLAYDMNSKESTPAKRILNFHIGKTANCLEYETTNISGTSVPLRIFYYLDENENADALNMVMTGSIAMSAANHRYPVNVVYKKIIGVSNAVFLVAIQQKEF